MTASSIFIIFFIIKQVHSLQQLSRIVDKWDFYRLLVVWHRKTFPLISFNDIIMPCPEHHFMMMVNNKVSQAFSMLKHSVMIFYTQGYENII